MSQPESRPSIAYIARSIARDMVLLPGRSTTSATVEAALTGVNIVQHLPGALEGDPKKIALLALVLGAIRFLRWAYTGGVTYHGGRDYRAHF